VAKEQFIYKELLEKE